MLLLRRNVFNNQYKFWWRYVSLSRNSPYKNNRPTIHDQMIRNGNSNSNTIEFAEVLVMFFFFKYTKDNVLKIMTTRLEKKLDENQPR